MRRIPLIVAMVAAVGLIAATTPDTTVKVTGNTVDTSLGENGSTGWWFGRDINYQTPFAFTTAQASTGFGSLHVPPIGANPSDKFIGELFLFTEVERVEFDYLLGPATNPNHVYLNVYANDPSSSPTKFYDCRYDYVATTGSTVDWSTLSTAASPTAVAKSNSYAGTCSPEGFDGLRVRTIALNVGQSGASDLGVSAYLDNVIVRSGGTTTAYDLEPTPPDADACTKGGFTAYGFPNQGQCVASLRADPRAGK